MKLCKDCKWCKPAWTEYFKPESIASGRGEFRRGPRKHVEVCMSPKQWNNNMQTFFHRRTVLIYALLGRCGYHGRWFEQKDKK